MTSIIKGIALFVGIAALTVMNTGSISAQVGANAEAPDGLETHRSELPDERDLRAPVPFARIQLANGDALAFYQITGSDGEVAFAVFGEGRPGNPSAVDRPEVAKANPLELFNAVSQPGTPLPRQLTERYGKAKLGRQGWLFGALEPSANHINWCDTNTFQDHMASWNYEHTLVRLNERPADHPERWAPETVSGDFFFTAQAWKYRATVYNVYQFYTRVAVFDLDSELLLCTNPFDCVPYGPWIQFRYRDHNNEPGSWGFAFGAHVPTNGIGYTAWWLFYTGVNWDWQTRIGSAETFEKFNIGLTWSH